MWRQNNSSLDACTVLVHLWTNVRCRDFEVKGKINNMGIFHCYFAPVFAQLIRTSDWDQNSGVRLVFGLSERLIQKVKSPTVYCARVLSFLLFEMYDPQVKFLCMVTSARLCPSMSEWVSLCVPKTLWTSYLTNRLREFHSVLVTDVLGFIDVLIIQRRSLAKNVGCFQRRLFVCLFVCLSTR